MLVIIGVVTAGMVLATSIVGRDDELKTESARLLALIGYAREQAELQTREYGLWLDRESYEFLGFDPLRGTWEAVEEDEVLRSRALPEGLEIALVVEGRPVVLRPPKDEAERLPHVMLFSNGDVTPFEVTLRRLGSEERALLASDERGAVVAREPKR